MGCVSGPQQSAGPAVEDSGSTSHRRSVRSWHPDASRMSAAHRKRRGGRCGLFCVEPGHQMDGPSRASDPFVRSF